MCKLLTRQLLQLRRCLIATLLTVSCRIKAIDLIDEAASSIRMQIDSKPEELDRLDRRIIQLKLEQQALMKESDEASKNARICSTKN